MRTYARGLVVKARMGFLRGECCAGELRCSTNPKVRNPWLSCLVPRRGSRSISLLRPPSVRVKRFSLPMATDGAPEIPPGGLPRPQRSLHPLPERQSFAALIIPASRAFITRASQPSIMLPISRNPRQKQVPLFGDRGQPLIAIL
jgi:hypothetical protein